ncbi:hypothetical protein I0C86_25060 [Plantactinospora sp. S1510]|uniref:Condensation domain-containing protein n=1 Tax=Plantactinospora alkalitolerans TaxID=2789879 RepID=A0ABS0H1I4_9ACTN|nr:condensation domain-containing protein [Plantactinospora alkalitolerans]MBF9132194.1 hypothetical protein [Plantactinospora alkalitolerans]
MSPLRDARLLTFQGASARNGMVPSGQLAAWQVLADLEFRYGPHLNLPLVVDIPPTVGDDEVLAALRVTVVRHEALRTTYERDRDAQLWAYAHPAGSIDVEIVLVSDTQLSVMTSEITARLRERPFRCDRELQVRAAVVRTISGAGHLVLVTSLPAVDGWSLHVLHDELSRQLRGEHADDEDGGWQPLDEGRHERSERGREARQRALSFWRRQLESMPALDRSPPRSTTAPRFWHAAFNSAATAHATRAVAATYRVAPSSVLLTAAAHTLAEHDGGRKSGLFVVVTNRNHSRLRTTVGHLSQPVPLYLDLHGDHATVLARTHASLLAAARYGQLDPTAATALIEEVSSGRSSAPELGRTFNYHRPTLPYEKVTHEPADYPALLRQSEFGWCDSAEAEQMTFYMHVWEVWPVAKLSFWVDTHYLSRQQSAAFAFRLEELLVAMAGVDPTCGESFGEG